jgi:hypothetical protein
MPTYGADQKFCGGVLEMCTVVMLSLSSDSLYLLSMSLHLPMPGPTVSVEIQLAARLPLTAILLRVSPIIDRPATHIISQGPDLASRHK